MRRALTTAAALLLSAGAALAGLDGDDVHVHGFVSQGWFNSSHNNYLVEDSRDGTAEFNEAAVSLQVQATERLRIGAQFLAHDFGETGNNVAKLDWAYGDYVWRDWLGLRIGKIKTMMGLYGEGRDIDMLRPTILLPQSVYYEGHRDFLVGVEGAGLHGNVPLDDAGGLDYDVWLGTLNVMDPDVGFWGDTFIDSGYAMAELLTARYGDEVRYLGSVDELVRFPWLVGGTLMWNAPLEGARTGVTFIRGQFEMESRDAYALRTGTTGSPLDWHRIDVANEWRGSLDHLLVISGELTRGAWTFASEYYQERLHGTTSEGVYAQATVQSCDLLAVSGYFSRFLRDREDPDGRQFERVGEPAFLAWQNDTCLAARFDVDPHWVLKAEYHMVDGLGQLSLAKNDVDDPDAWHHWWSYMAAKATFHF
jgi:hypothetical protein